METVQLEKQIAAWYNCWFRLRGVYQVWAEDVGLTHNTLFVLYVINRHENGCSQKEICDYLMLSKQTVSAILKKLEKKGYIIRETKAADKRNNLVRFTPAGENCVKPILELLFKLEIEAYGSMSPSYLDELITKSTKIAEVLEKTFKVE